MRPLIYVSGPLSEGTGKSKYSNIVRAVEVGEELYDKGWHPYIPHLTALQHRIIQRIQPGYIPPYERWMEFDKVILDRCEAMYFIDPSPGANEELRFAKSRRIPVYYCMEEVPRGEDVMEIEDMGRGGDKL